ncbi:tyrosine recombinase XerD [mine drainage metagenome]|uniref:Tyrosine recombinase XerD n=1 Tax=mine drainage metagenome TaxID=410659 RepID=A0A1J5QYG9_9ZZZZ
MPGRKPLSETELTRVYAALERGSLRDQALVTLGLHTGYRITELLSLNVGDVWDGREVRPQLKVNRARMKGGRGARRTSISSRSIPLNGTAVQALRRFLFSRYGSGPAQPTDPLFSSRFHGKRLTRWGANDIVHRVLIEAGIDDCGDLGTHTLRKTFCRKIYEKTGRDIQVTRAAMGHRHCSTTQLYLHVDEEQIRAAVLALSDSTKTSDSLFSVAR